MEQLDPETTQSEPGPEQTYRGTPPGKGVIILRILLPLCAIAGGLFVALWLMKTSPEAKPRVKNSNATLVNVQLVEFLPRKVQLTAMGTVRPKQDVSLKPQVSGEIVALSNEFQPGGFFAAGETLLRIDDTDYRLALEQLTGEVARAEAELQLEQGNQLVALKEFELLGEPVSEEEKNLMLRKPQLENLRAALNIARSKQEQTRVNLQRTEITAPFNALVMERYVDLGTRVNSASDLARLVGTDAYWVEVSLPVGQLRWINIPKTQSATGARARIYDRAAWGDALYRDGRVARLSATVEEKGRMARLLVEVADPLALLKENSDKPGLLLNSYVRVDLEGRQLTSTAAISRDFLRDGDTLWIMDREDKLDIRTVEIVFRGEKEVYIASGVATGERLITTILPTPVQGMSLRLSGEGQQQEMVGSVGQAKPAGEQ